MKLFRFFPVFLVSLLFVSNPSRADNAPNPFVGGWALHLPGGDVGWLGIESDGNHLTAQILWAWGSVLKADSARMDGDKLVVTRHQQVNRTSPDGKVTKTFPVQTIIATRDGDSLKLVSIMPAASGNGDERAEFSGKRLPPMPPAPNLATLKFGPPIQLFNGTSLNGWRPVEDNAINGWGARNGILYNEAPQEKNKPRKEYANLRTVAEFEDFALHAETRVPKDGNSGIFLRGIYEVQILDSYGMPLDPHNMGAIYSRIKPTANAEKPAGQWQTVDITYVDRHATVVLNGVKIIDNQPILGPTGGALWPEVDRPGPIYLQGDHTGIEYRNLVLRPVIK
jgi:hypothetical protein